MKHMIPGIAFPNASQESGEVRRTRPPGCCPETELAELCFGCGDCVGICPQTAIDLDDNGHPVLLAAASCDLCGLCADVCSMKAIKFSDQTAEGFAFELFFENAAGPFSPLTRTTIRKS